MMFVITMSGTESGNAHEVTLDQDDVLHAVVAPAAVAGPHLHRVRRRAPLTDEHRVPNVVDAAAVDEGDQAVECAAGSGGSR